MLNNVVLQLFITFLKIGAFTFGGGYAMIPIIKRELVENKKWINENDILDIVAIAESTPGPIAINASTFVGYKVAGFFGAFFSTLGVVLPSFVIISGISFVLNIFRDLLIVKYAFWGIRAGVLALILHAFLMLFKQRDRSLSTYIIALLAFVFAVFTSVNVIFVIIGCGLLGLFSYAISRRRGKV